MKEKSGPAIIKRAAWQHLVEGGGEMPPFNISINLLSAQHIISIGQNAIFDSFVS